MSYAPNPVPGMIDITVSGAVPNSLGTILISRAPSSGVSFNSGANVLWVDSSQLIPYFDPYTFNYDSNGQFTWTTSVNDPNIISSFGNGFNAYIQAFNLPTNSPSYVRSSNGLQIGYI